MSDNTFLWFKLTDWALLTIPGDITRVNTFLQGQLSCDMQAITPEQNTLAAYCNHKGRIEASLRVFRYQDQLYFYLPQSMSVHTMTLLNKYAAFSRLQVTDAHEQVKLLGCAGDIDPGVLQPYFPALPQQAHQVISTEAGVIMAIPSQGDTLRYLIAGTPKLIDGLKQAFQSITPPAPDWQWHLGDIQAGIAIIYPETQGLFTPHKLNYPKLGAVSFTKGCFIGQEIIARMEHLGKAQVGVRQMWVEGGDAPKRGAFLVGDEASESKGDQPKGHGHVRVVDVERCHMGRGYQVLGVGGS